MTFIERELRYLGSHAKKSLGQHFLTDRKALHQIVNSAELTSEDIVIEVGPGLGILTQELAQRVRQVIAVEIDKVLVTALEQYFKIVPNVSIIHGDILQLTPDSLLPQPSSSYKVVADLPYYIASAVLRHFLESSVKPSRIVVLVQKEVGEAIVAPQGKLNLLAISVQFYGMPTLQGYLSPQSFYPPPQVESAILRVDLYEKPVVSVNSTDAFFQSVRAGFSAPRKQLRNALAQGLKISTSDSVVLLTKAGINPRYRAENLCLEEWASLSRQIEIEGRAKGEMVNSPSLSQISASSPNSGHDASVR